MYMYIYMTRRAVQSRAGVLRVASHRVIQYSERYFTYYTECVGIRLRIWRSIFRTNVKKMNEYFSNFFWRYELLIGYTRTKDGQESSENENYLWMTPKSATIVAICSNQLLLRIIKPSKTDSLFEKYSVFIQSSNDHKFKSNELTGSILVWLVNFSRI